MGRNKTIADRDLLAAAREVFQTKGHAATTREVAQAAGISQAVLYQRFRSKEDLFLAAMMPPAPDYTAWLENDQGDDVQAFLVEVASHLLAFLREAFPLVLQLVTYPGLGAHAVHHAHAHFEAVAFVDSLADRLRAFQSRGLVAPSDFRAVAMALVASAHGIAIARVLPAMSLDAEDTERQLRALVSVIWYGIAPHGPLANGRVDSG